MIQIVKYDGPHHVHRKGVSPTNLVIKINYMGPIVGKKKKVAQNSVIQKQTFPLQMAHT